MVADITAGKEVRTLDGHQPSITVTDDTSISNIATSVGFTFQAGTPEIGVFFIAPTSGKVMYVVGGGSRDNGGTKRVFISVRIFENDSNGTVVLSPGDTKSYGSGSAETNFMYASRIQFVESLTPGQQYYARVEYAVDSATDPDTADISARDVSVIPLT